MTIFDDLEANILINGETLEEFVGTPNSTYFRDSRVRYIEAAEKTRVAVKVIVGRNFPWYDATKLLVTMVLGGVKILSEMDRPLMDGTAFETSWEYTLDEQEKTTEHFSFETFRKCMYQIPPRLSNRIKLLIQGHQGRRTSN